MKVNSFLPTSYIKNDLFPQSISFDSPIRNEQSSLFLVPCVVKQKKKSQTNHSHVCRATCNLKQKVCILS